MTLLEISALAVRRGERRTLRGVSFAVAPGELVGLIGPNGAGKSTLLRAAMGLLNFEGSVTIGGADASELSARERAKRVAYLPQEREIAWPIAVETLVSLGREPHRAPGAGLSARDRAAVAEAMRKADLSALAERPATTLSGGERARALIARALAQEAPLLLADEPTAGLGPAHQIALMQRFSDLAAGGAGIVVSLHDLGLAARWCTRLLLLDAGRLIADGAPEEALTPTILREVYGVEAFRAETEDGLVLLPTRLSVSAEAAT